MKLTICVALRAVLVIALMFMTLGPRGLQADTGNCGGASVTLPFTDVMGNAFFCEIAEAFFSGLANGTTATTYNPAQNVSRDQMAAFATRTLDQSLKRGNRRAALGQWWTTQTVNSFALTSVGAGPALLASDGEDLWVAGNSGGNISRVRASDGRLLDTWTALSPFGVLVASGRIFVTGSTSPGKIYIIDPTQLGGTAPVFTSGLGVNPLSIAYDGQRLWTANIGFPGSVSIVTLSPLTVTNIATGFVAPVGILYDGSNIWVTDKDENTLKELDSSGAILRTVSTGTNPLYPVFDGTNIWVPNGVSNSVTVVRAKGALAGTVLATLTDNGLNAPSVAAFDGERILVTNGLGDGVSLWKASDFTPIGSFQTGVDMFPLGACSDGINFWITLHGAPGKLARF